MRKDSPNVLYLISILIYVLACIMPAYVEARNSSWDAFNLTAETIYEDCRGWACLLDGILLPLGLLKGYWGTIVWIANAFYFSALLLSLLLPPNVGPFIKVCPIIFSFMSVVIGSMLMFFTLRYCTKDYFCWIDQLLAGYYLWLLSFNTLLIGLFADLLSKKPRRWFSFAYSISMIPICVSIILPTNAKGDNSIRFDDASQSLIANSSIDALVIDDGIQKCLIKRRNEVEGPITLKDLESSFFPVERGSNPITLKENRIYEIYNATQVRAPRQKIRIEISADGKATSIEIPREEGDNSFWFDMESQCLVTASYFECLVVDNYEHLYWLDRKGWKRNKIPIHDLGLFFEEINDTILPLKASRSYIINNYSHSNESINRLNIHLNKNGAVDSVSYLPPTKNITSSKRLLGNHGTSE